MKFQLSTPPQYSLRSVLLSHGWSDLPPFDVSENHQKVRFALSGKNRPTLVELSQNGLDLEIQSNRKLTASEINLIQRMFRTDISLEPFLNLAEKHDRSWITRHKMGRMLRGQTVFEDLIKLILTTNCTWSLTKKMVGDLCTKLGDKVEDLYCFPTPQAMSKKNENYYRTTVKTGYRAPHMVSISRMVASGELDPESWMTSDKSYTELRKEILALPGAGPYVAENLLRLLGRFDGLGVDSWVRGRLQKMWNMRKQPTDSKILKGYKHFGEYKGLILWCDVTRDWHEPKVDESSRSSKVSS